MPSPTPSRDRSIVKWFLIAAGIVLVLGVGTVGIVAYLFGPGIVDKAIVAVDTLGELSEAQARLQSEYPGEQIQVHGQTVNGEPSLTISFVNSERAKLGPDARKLLAFEAAELTFNVYPEAMELTHIAVVFTKSASTGVIRFTDNTDGYRFTPEELMK